MRAALVQLLASLGGMTAGCLALVCIWRAVDGRWLWQTPKD